MTDLSFSCDVNGQFLKRFVKYCVKSKKQKRPKVDNFKPYDSSI